MPVNIGTGLNIVPQSSLGSALCPKIHMHKQTSHIHLSIFIFIDETEMFGILANFIFYLNLA